MSDVTAYNEMVETAFLNTNRRLRQALTALQACVSRLNEVCDPNEEWWQNVDAFFEDATLIDPRSKEHIFDVNRRAVRQIVVTIPHALDISGSLNYELVQTAINKFINSLENNGMGYIKRTEIPVAGHTVIIQTAEEQTDDNEPYVTVRGPF